MEKLIIYFKRPYEEKGILKATLDFALRLVTFVVWLYALYIAGSLALDALLHNFNPLLKLWWCAYGFIIAFGATWIAYIILLVRDYYEEGE